MGGGKGKAPAAPNYSALASQDAEAQRKTAELITQQNRPTQKDALGNSMNWSKDAAGNWTQTEKWDPRVTAGYDQAFKLKDQAQKDLTGAKFEGPEAVNWDPFGSKQYADALYTNYAGRAFKEQGDAQQAMQTQLRQQGLQPGTEAYDRAYKNLLTAQGDANAQASLEANTRGYDLYRNDFNARNAAQDQAYKQADANYTRKWDTAGAANNLLNSQYRPTYQGFSGATGYNPADMMGAAQASYGAKMGGYNAEQAKKGNTMNTAASIGSMAMMSDMTLKHDIQPLVGRDALEALLQLGGYTWRWNDSGEVDAGVLAQEVQRILPQLVVKPADHLMVNYTGLVALAIESIKYLVGELPCTQK